MYLTRNQAWWQHHRGFESHLLRQYKGLKLAQQALGLLISTQSLPLVRLALTLQSPFTRSHPPLGLLNVFLDSRFGCTGISCLQIRYDCTVFLHRFV